MKRLAVIGILVIGVVTLSGCLNNSASNSSSSLNKSQVTKINDNYIKEKSAGNYENNIFKRNNELFTGRETILEIDVDKTSNLTVLYNFSHVNNKISLLLTDNHKRGYLKKVVSLENKDVDNSKELVLDKGTYYLKLVGEEATFDLTLAFGKLPETIAIKRVDYLGDALDFDFE